MADELRELSKLGSKHPFAAVSNISSAKMANQKVTKAPSPPPRGVLLPANKILYFCLFSQIPQSSRNSRLPKRKSTLGKNLLLPNIGSAINIASFRFIFQSGFNHSHDKPLPPTPTHPKPAEEKGGTGTLILRHVSLSPQRRKRSNSSNLMRDPQHQQLIGGSRSSLNHLANIGKQTSAPEVGGIKFLILFSFSEIFLAKLA